MKYLAATWFAILGMLTLSRALSGLISAAVDLKLYLPIATRSERPALFWTFLCLNFLLVALSALLMAVALTRLN